MTLLLPVLILLLAPLVGFFANRLPGKLVPYVVPLPALLAFLALLVAGIGWLNGSQDPSVSLAWVPYLDFTFDLRLNGFGLLVGLLVTGIGTLIMLYATGYMAGHAQASRLFGYLYAFMFAMLGIVLSDHLLLVFVFWELTSITSYLLIGFNHADSEARKKSLQALVVTGLGGMALLAGFILMYAVTGVWRLSELVAHHDTLVNHALYPGILVLVLLGAFTKSGQFPFHFWLPNAMAAPTPVSAYLHSATMVKAGVFLMAVLSPILGGTDAWQMALQWTGGATLLVGAWFGLFQHDLKKILAATTLAVLGLLTLLIGIGTEKAYLAATAFLLGHALYKATLFMVAGAIDHETGTRDIRVLGGLGKLMPWTAAAAALAAISKMGLPPLFGFIGKEYAYKASLGAPADVALSAVLILGNAMLFALAFKVAFLPFWRKQSLGVLPKHAHEAPWTMWLGPLLLGSLGLLFGLFPGWLDALASQSKTAMLGYPETAQLKLWEGFNLPLLLSVITVVLGVVFCLLHKRIYNWLSRQHLPDMEHVYQDIFEGTMRLASWQTRRLQSGYLRNYLIITVMSIAVMVTLKLWRFGGVELPEMQMDGILPVALIALLMLAAIPLVIFTHSRLTALVGLGVIGFGVAGLFALFSAPDLAITQILVETLTVALFASVVHHMPRLKDISSTGTRLIDAAIAGSVGLLVTLLVLKSKAVYLAPPISEQLAQWSLPEAYGANVVNVILVDFRALDTWGEITVLAIAAIGVWSLLRSQTKGKGPNE